ncbi:MAG TPA: hypothetical protein VFR87_12405 [Nocardioidaceae bacterium]|nr:hypothetical protein [Nocardioidaceae bacterium]
MADLSTRSRETAASVGGAGLAAATRVVAAVRPAAKPLHPKGDVVTARLRRSGGHHTGSAWLDQAGSDEVLVRRSRAVGLPAGLPDIHGLAIRIPLQDGRQGDLLLAMTGRGRLTRFLLTAGRTPYSRPLTTLLPYRTPTGPKLVAAVARTEHRYELAYASAGGSWHPFGDLVLSSTQGPDPLVSFDPVRNTLPGLDNYDWVRRLREPAYRTARYSR